MTNFHVIYCDLPCCIKGFVRKYVDEYAIVLNSRLTREQNKKTMMHELDHIKNDDFYRDVDVQQLENHAHGL